MNGGGRVKVPGQEKSPELWQSRGWRGKERGHFVYRFIQLDSWWRSAYKSIGAHRSCRSKAARAEDHLSDVHFSLSCPSLLSWPLTAVSTLQCIEDNTALWTLSAPVACTLSLPMSFGDTTMRPAGTTMTSTLT